MKDDKKLITYYANNLFQVDCVILAPFTFMYSAAECVEFLTYDEVFANQLL